MVMNQLGHRIRDESQRINMKIEMDDDNGR